MAVGEFYTYNVWELRTGYNGRELEEITRVGIIPQYGRIEGVKEVKLFRIDEGDDAGKYIAVTVYESREVYNRWFTTNSREFQVWQANLSAVLERWMVVSDRSAAYRATLVVDHAYGPKGDEPPPPPVNPNRPTVIF